METLIEYLPIILPAAALLVWLVRLESRGVANEKEIRRLWTQRKEDLESAKNAREDTNNMLAEIRNDVKRLLGKKEGS